MSPSKYLLNPPEELHPYTAIANDKYKNKVPSDQESKLIYPDFGPWKHKKEEDQILLNFVSKGYYVSSKVNFESISARSSLHESLPNLSNELASQFSKVLKIREQEINKISSSDNNPASIDSLRVFNPLAGPGFVLPNRVTLTDNRKELWLQELSSPHTSLHKISKFIPHGLKRRQVIEQCYVKQIPLRRAIWLLKTCYSIEAHALQVKYLNTNSNSKSEWDLNRLINDPNTDLEKISESISSPLYKEWTDNFVYILEKLVFEMNQYYNDAAKLKKWKTELNYFLKLLGNCYSLDLLNKEVFHHWLIEFISKIELFEFLPTALHILTIFWDKLINSSNLPDKSFSLQCNNSTHSTNNNFLVSKITDILLYKYYVVSNAKSMINDESYIINDVRKNTKIKESILSILRNLIWKLFQRSTLDIFLFNASSWDLYKPYIFEIISLKWASSSTVNKGEIKKKLELISYRNETLRSNSLLATSSSAASSPSNTSNWDADYSNIFKSSSKDPNLKVIRIQFADISFTKKLDDNSTAFDWAQYIDQNPLQKTQILQLILWAIHPSRTFHYESMQLVAKILLLQINSSLADNFPEYEIEDLIWSVVFQIAKLNSTNLKLLVCLKSLYKILNILIIYGIIKVPTYIRKLISSGIMYLQDSGDKFLHVNLIINLKISPLMKSQFNMVLRNVIEYDPSFYEQYNFDTLLKAAESNKERLLSGDYDGSSHLNLPQSSKIMLAEACLNHLCSGSSPEPVSSSMIMRMFNLFWLDLDVLYHFYKWIEFIVYHQLLADIDAMETLIDILIKYQKLFSQFVNDHILFTKTFIYIYSKILKGSDALHYNILSFVKFWKFFMKNFPVALIIDNDLKHELSEIYEEEKNKLKKLQEDDEFVHSLFKCLNDIDFHVSNCAKLFQLNIKVIISDSNETEIRQKSRYNLLLLMSANSREYNKLMSIFLKRKSFQEKDLIKLISAKLLTMEQISSTLGISFVLDLLTYNSKNDVRSEIFYQFHEEEFIKSNLKSILISCQLDLSKRYTTFIGLVTTYGPISQYSRIVTTVLMKTLKQRPTMASQIMNDILNFNCRNQDVQASTVDDGEDDDTEDEVSIDEPLLYETYSMLDFTNLWVFQAFTGYQFSKILEKNETQEDIDEYLKEFLYKIFDVTELNELTSELFDEINQIEWIDKIVQLVENDFFENILLDSGENKLSREYLILIVDTTTSLSRKFTKLTSANSSLFFKCFDKCERIISKFVESDNLQPIALQLDVSIKILTIHQNSVLETIVQGLKTESERDRINKFVTNLFKLFEKVSFSLKLKLLLYEILSSLKSYCYYVATLGETSIDDENVSIVPQGRSNSKMQNDFKVPENLINLPPFQVSSFMKVSDDNTDSSVALNLGITPTKDVDYSNDHGRWFIYDKKSKRYVCKFKNVPYNNIKNYQNDTDPVNSFNNGCYNLSLFDASYENKNPH
ncbi:hypothetical protein KAFR_0F04270 [Kazachstania africana CBS 2517]|uniref:Mediator of RNA polymerase II transcription subunit 12 n=1 Tax=Kazachstania africana (strain ATCC 22294 / BCRC 22015 / CBS 2517 / CECT 1963 / NBRC 1671 / NRRL Y-8276) TaxID=1071382 RepID=H2AXC2_KAZAF|nr:hypothetical protein KAFR_0F04270 [Kazachstania africana CBS 2517]CCF59022.1 hypothetical protein KAFR_0F04270 [Kazachstania africana CBS 2517]